MKLAGAAGWPPLVFLFWSILGSGLILLAGTTASGNRPGHSRPHLVYYLASGLLSIALPNALSFPAVAHIGASVVALCQAFPPLVTYGLALAFGMEKIAAGRALGILCGLAGALVLVLAKGFEAGGDLPWVAAAIASSVFLAFGNIYRSLRWPAGASALSLAPGMLLGGALILRLWAAAAGVALDPLPMTGLKGLLLAAQIAVFAASYALSFFLQKLAGPVYLSQIGSVGGILGAAFAVLVLGEAARPELLAAAVLILTGVVLVNKKSPPPHRQAR